ncbi:2187_t:CDS:2, partial [Scutellospora calospora]
VRGKATFVRYRIYSKNKNTLIFDIQNLRVTIDNNKLSTIETSTTTIYYQEHLLTKSVAENQPLTISNLEIQEQALTVTSSSATNIEIKSIDTDQDIILIETNKNNSADNSIFITNILKISKNKSKKKEQNYTK